MRLRLSIGIASLLSKERFTGRRRSQMRTSTVEVSPKTKLKRSTGIARPLSVGMARHNSV
jgi:hypothetical protein